MKLFYRSFGEGRPLVILHGLFGLSDNWVSVGRTLSDKYRVIIPDARNHGQSPHSHIFGFPSMEEDLQSLLDDLEIERVILMGHSLGGKTSMFFALHHPERVEKLIVVDISMRKYPPNRDHQMLLEAMMAVDFATVSSRSDVERQLSEKVSDTRLLQFLMKNIYRKTPTSFGWRLNLEVINESLLSVFEGVNPGGIFFGPALFIRGGRSNYISDEDWDDIKMKFPGAALQTIALGTHWVHADAPGEFLGIVSDFLDQ